MNTTYETSELTSSKTNMAPTTTFAKSKKGVVVLVALCMMFFYTGRLSSSTSGDGASFDASLLRGFHQDVVGTADPCAADPCSQGCAACPARCNKIVQYCQKEYVACNADPAGQCNGVLTAVSKTCGCGDGIDCAEKFLSGHSGNQAIQNGIRCAESHW